MPSEKVSTGLPEGRVSTGNPELDTMLQGGLVGRRPYLIVGPSGTGKTTVALQFLCEGVRHGERVLLVTVEEPPNETRINHRGLGPALDEVDVFDAIPDIMRYERAPFKDIASVRNATPFKEIPLTIRTSPELSAVEVTMAGLEQMLRTEVVRRGYSRIAVDSLTALQYFCMKGFDPIAGAQAFLRFLSDLRVTTLLTVESPLEDVETPERMLARGEIRLFRWELESRSVRAIGVEKFRGSPHDVRLHPYRIGPHGIDIQLSTTISRDTRQIIEAVHTTERTVVAPPADSAEETTSPVDPLADEVRDLVLVGADVRPVRVELESALGAVTAGDLDAARGHLSRVSACVIGLVDGLRGEVARSAGPDPKVAEAYQRIRQRSESARTGLPPLRLPPRRILEVQLAWVLSLIPPAPTEPMAPVDESSLARAGVWDSAVAERPAPVGEEGAVVEDDAGMPSTPAGPAVDASLPSSIESPGAEPEVEPTATVIGPDLGTSSRTLAELPEGPDATVARDRAESPGLVAALVPTPGGAVGAPSNGTDRFFSPIARETTPASPIPERSSGAGRSGWAPEGAVAGGEPGAVPLEAGPQPSAAVDSSRSRPPMSPESAAAATPRPVPPLPVAFPDRKLVSASTRPELGVDRFPPLENRPVSDGGRPPLPTILGPASIETTSPAFERGPTPATTPAPALTGATVGAVPAEGASVRGRPSTKPASAAKRRRRPSESGRAGPSRPRREEVPAPPATIGGPAPAAASPPTEATGALPVATGPSTKPKRRAPRKRKAPTVLAATAVAIPPADPSPAAPPAAEPVDPPVPAESTTRTEGP